MKSKLWKMMVPALVVSAYGAVGEVAEFVGAEIGFGMFLSEAQARRGRPLTPVSYAGVARRTTRRVAYRTSYRINVLPTGCIYGPYYGANYWRCGGTYYLKEGTVYIKVTF
jgi:hypothetical protein